MKKVGIVYWSGTGNTQAMAEYIAAGVKSAGGEAELLRPEEFTAARWPDFGAVAFGCPAMGAEELEEMEFEPMFASLEGTLSGKRIALFGSYGWGDGEWMHTWCARCDAAGAILCQEEGLTAHEAPDEAARKSCRELGRKLANW